MSNDEIDLMQRRSVGRFSQTLDELLGLTPKPNLDHVNNQEIVIVPMVEASPPRPSTRHGRPKSQDEQEADERKEKEPPHKNETEIKKIDSWQRDSNEDSDSSLSAGDEKSLSRNRRLSFTVLQDDEASKKGTVVSAITKKTNGEVSKAKNNNSRNTKDNAQSFHKSADPKKVQRRKSKEKVTPKQSANVLPSRIDSKPNNDVTVMGHDRVGKASFEAWLSAKNSFSRQLKLKQKAIEAEKEKEKENRQKEAQRAFNSWKERHDENEKKKRDLAKQAMNSREAKEKTENEKKHIDAAKKEQRQQMRNNMDNMKKLMQLEETEKRKEAQKSFDAWQKKKKEIEERQKQQSRDSRRRIEEDERIATEYKESLSVAAYNIWLEMKQREREDAKSLGGRILRYEDEAQIRWPIPWIPPNPSIPRVFTPTGRGRRTSRKQQISKAISRTRSLNSIVSRR